MSGSSTGCATSGRRSSLGAEVVSWVATMLAISLLVATGGLALPAALRSLIGESQADSTSTIALLLNVALVLFGWRRCKDIGAEKRAREEAERASAALAYRDFTTGLLNRRGLSKAYEAHQFITESGIALLIVDLDRFKSINDMHGHAAGDKLLLTVAQTLQEESPTDAYVARLGGDEFAIVAFDLSENEAGDLAARCNKRLAMPLTMFGRLAHVSASIGVTWTASKLPLDDLLRRGDIAMYEAKRRGKDQNAWFDPAMEEALQQRSFIEAGIRAGIEAGQFVPFFQPQVDLRTGKLHGFEVLARWLHPEEGTIEPQRFIEIAEEAGLIGELSLSVMRQALLVAKSWPPHLTISVNLSPLQLKDPGLPEKILQTLTQAGFPAGRLELEITESALFDDLALALASVESLKNLGVTISLDDFGTGYSSLTQLQALPFDRIKIDKSFVLTMHDNAESAAIVDAIARLAGSLQLPITAEGVESAEAQALLVGLGCDQGQGWLYGRPLPAKELQKVLDAAGVATLPQSECIREIARSSLRRSAERRSSRRRGRASAA